MAGQEGMFGPSSRSIVLSTSGSAAGHTVYEVDHAAAVVAKLGCYAIDVLVLGELEHPFEAPKLVRGARADQRLRIHPFCPSSRWVASTITLALTASHASTTPVWVTG